MRQRSKERRDSRRSNATHLAIAVLSALLVLAPFAAADGVSDLELGMDAAQEPEANVLTVDARDGEVTAWDYRGATLTDIHVTHIPPPVLNLSLVQPTGWASFVNQAGGLDGRVEFWGEQLRTGTYAVVRETDAGPELVTEFDVTSLAKGAVTSAVDPGDVEEKLSGWEPHNPDSRSGSRSGKSGGGSSGSSCTTRTQTVMLQSKDLWTPLVLLHSPYMGSADASAGWTSGTVKLVGPYSKSSTKSYYDVIETENGKTKGALQLARWGDYRETRESSGCGGSSIKYYTKVASWKPMGYEYSDSFWLYGSSTTTDSDDLQTVSRDGYGGLTFYHRYATKEHVFKTTDGSRTATVSSSKYMGLSASISFSRAGYTLSATYSVSSGTSVAWTYNFPQQSGYCWHIDYLGDGSSGGWAFKYTSSCT